MTSHAPSAPRRLSSLARLALATALVVGTFTTSGCSALVDAALDTSSSDDETVVVEQPRREVVVVERPRCERVVFVERPHDHWHR